MPRPHPAEFRQRAVELARRREQPIAKIAEDLGISESCLRRWMDIADVDDGQKPGLTTDERAELVPPRPMRHRPMLRSATATCDLPCLQHRPAGGAGARAQGPRSTSNGTGAGATATIELGSSVVPPPEPAAADPVGGLVHMLPIVWAACAVVIATATIRARHDARAARVGRWAVAVLFPGAGAVVNTMFLATGEDDADFAGGRHAQLGYVAAIAFHVTLLSVGWGFYLWSIPMIGAFSLLLRAERQSPGLPTTAEVQHAVA